MRKNEDIAEKVRREVASAYHNGVLRSIMVRNPNSGLVKKKYLHNFLFLPVSEVKKTVKFTSLYGKSVEINLAQMNSDNAITVGTGANKEVMSFDDYLVNFENATDGAIKRDKKNLIIKTIFNKLNVTDECFEKVNSINYYIDRLNDMPTDLIVGTTKSAVTNDFVPFAYKSDKDCFDAKMQKMIDFAISCVL